MCENCSCGEKSMHDKVAEVIETIRPMLQNDGGDIELVSVEEDNTVKVRLQGACKGCPGAQQTLKMGVERMLKEQLAEVKRFPNGIGFGPDNRLYVAESITQKVLVYDWSPEGLGAPEEFCVLPAGFPDGFCFATDGTPTSCIASSQVGSCRIGLSSNDNPYLSSTRTHRSCVEAERSALPYGNAAPRLFGGRVSANAKWPQSLGPRH